jgi:hypothetical protein
VINGRRMNISIATPRGCDMKTIIKLFMTLLCQDAINLQKG